MGAKLLELSASFNYFYNPASPNGPIQDTAIRNESIRKLYKSIAILPNSFPEPYAYLSYLYLSIDSLDLSYAVLRNAIQKGLDSDQIKDLKQRISISYLTRGDSCFANKNVECSVLNYKKAIEANPENARAWWNYGGICYEKGDIASTIDAWERVLQINPDYPHGKEFLQQVKMSSDSLRH